VGEKKKPFVTMFSRKSGQPVGKSWVMGREKKVGKKVPIVPKKRG